MRSKVSAGIVPFCVLIDINPFDFLLCDPLSYSIFNLLVHFLLDCLTIAFLGEQSINLVSIHLKDRGKLIGYIVCLILIYFTWPWFVESWRLGEGSSNAGGLIRWPVKVLQVGVMRAALLRLGPAEHVLLISAHHIVFDGWSSGVLASEIASLYRAFADSLASENASRLAAMQSAEKNIEERLEELFGQFHRQRQSTITEELLDIVCGFEAMGGAKQAGARS